ncbi:MAG: spermidine synthase, partial [Nitrosotalea sp.]
VCYRYFALPKSPRLQVKITDAFHFINQTTHQYDLLFIDLFINDDVPKWPSSFFSLCRQRLKNKKSVLICNFLTGGSKDLLFEFLTQVAASFDQHTIILPTKNGENYILFAFPETIEFPTSWVMFQKILNIEKKIRFPFSQIWNDVSQLVLAASKS